MIQSKLFERLVTKFSIKVNDLARYLEVSKATIYNYRNFDAFDQIPNDKQYKIFYLFGKENVNELSRLLDENDKNVLVKYTERIDSIFQDKEEKASHDTIAIETLQKRLNEATAQLESCRNITAIAMKLEHLDDITKKVIIDKVSEITCEMNSLEIKNFLDYLQVYAVYSKNALRK
jgi:hypothetical protein